MPSQTNWNSILEDLNARRDLSREQSSWALSEIMSGTAPETEVSEFLLALRSKGETVEELAGLVDTMLENSLKLETGNDALDIVGTGGDMIGTVNISSMASILAAATGVPVLKHGSKSASGKTGSSEMLSELGLNLELSPERVAQVFKETGITFFFALVFHPAMRHVAPIRKKLGVPTTFNFLGPLANPAQPLATSLGVANEQIAPLMAQELAQRGRFGLVSRGNDGLDEITTTTTSQIWEISPNQVTKWELDPVRFGIKRANLEQLLGGDASQNAQIARDLFEGRTTGNLGAVRDIVILNAAGGVVAYQAPKNPDIVGTELTNRFESAIQRVTVALESGKANSKLEQWIQASN
jgi:anthranilate phosphoribosyltransferase